MGRATPGAAAPGTDGPAYHERLSVPWRWWALSTMFLASVLLAFLVAMPAAVALGAVAVMALGVGALFLGYGAAVVSVHDGVLTAGSARIPVDYLAAPEALDVAATRAVIGVDANARAFHVIRPYLKRSVKVHVVDPSDPTPYWLITTRHPRRLTAALVAAIDREPGSDR